MNARDLPVAVPVASSKASRKPAGALAIAERFALTHVPIRRRI